MRRVHTTFDLLEAHSIVAMMREQDVAAFVFDADFVRQDWFKQLVYGGFRIVVPDEATAAALEVLARYRDGELALDDDGLLTCLACHADSGREDPQPRRNVFLGIILLSIIAALALLAPEPSAAAVFWASTACIVSMLLPGLVMGYYKWAVRCANCGYRWQQKPLHSFSELAQSADTAAGQPALRLARWWPRIFTRFLYPRR